MLRVRLVLVVCAVALAGAGGCGLLDDVHRQVGAKAWPGCDTFPVQEAAQKTWELAGRPKIAGSENGRVCEQLGALTDATDIITGRKDPLTGATGDDGCRRRTGPVRVRLSRAAYPETTLNFETAVRHGIGPVFHVDRAHDKRNRAAWKPLVPKSLDTDSDGQVDDRDEWPPASSREAARRTRSGLSRSQVAFVDPADNRGAGAVMGARLRSYCDGQAFRIVPFGTRTRPTAILIVARDGRRIRERVVAER